MLQAALGQIEEKRYDTALPEKEMTKNGIRKYGFTFKEKKVLIGQAQKEAWRQVLKKDFFRKMAKFPAVRLRNGDS